MTHMYISAVQKSVMICDKAPLTWYNIKFLELALKEIFVVRRLKIAIFYLHLVLNFFFYYLGQILQDYSSYDLTRPMPGLTDDQHRTVIHEGSLRLLEKPGKVRFKALALCSQSKTTSSLTCNFQLKVRSGQWSGCVLHVSDMLCPYVEPVW